MMIQHPRKMPLIVSMIGVKKLTSGVITRSLNQVDTAFQMAFIPAHRREKNPVTAPTIPEKKLTSGVITRSLNQVATVDHTALIFAHTARAVAFTLSQFLTSRMTTATTAATAATTASSGRHRAFVAAARAVVGAIAPAVAAVCAAVAAVCPAVAPADAIARILATDVTVLYTARTPFAILYVATAAPTAPTSARTTSLCSRIHPTVSLAAGMMVSTTYAPAFWSASCTFGRAASARSLT